MTMPYLFFGQNKYYIYLFHFDCTHIRGAIVRDAPVVLPDKVAVILVAVPAVLMGVDVGFV